MDKFSEISKIPTYWKVSQSEVSKFGLPKMFDNKYCVELLYIGEKIIPITEEQANERASWGSCHIKYTPDEKYKIVSANFDTSG